MDGMIMTQTQILQYYREIIQHPALVLELSEYQRSKIQEFAKSEWLKALSKINDIMLANPNYEYPDNLNGKYVDYWSERLSTAKDAKRVLSALETYGNSDGQEMTIKKTDVPVGKVLAEVEIANPSDPAKLQRGLISLVKQYQSTTGTKPIFKHPFFWHTKHTHNNISPYTLVVNKDEVSTDETGRVIDTNVVQLTEADINQSFVEFILSCHINQIAPFLTFQFEKYYNSLLANESAQPFFDYVIELMATVNQQGLLYKAEKDAFLKWIISNPYYNPEALEPPTKETKPKPNKDISSSKRSEDTQRKARQAVTLYENKLDELVKCENGKRSPKSDKDIVELGLQDYCRLAKSQNLGSDPKSLGRYLKDIGKQGTALQYGRQLVRQLRERK